MATRFEEIVGPYLSDQSVAPVVRTEDMLGDKARSVLEAGNQKKADISGSPVSPYVAAAVRQTGTGDSLVTDPVQRDQVYMDAWSLLQKYGPAAGPLIEQSAAGANAFNADSQQVGTVRGSLSRAQDVGLGLGQGFANGVLGIGALALGGFDALTGTEAGTWAARKIGDLNDWVDDRKSDQNAVQRRRYEVLSQLTSADHRAQYEQEKARDGEFVAGLRRFGRDAASALGHVWDSPEMLRDTVAQGTGSLLAGGPITKALKLAGGAALGTRLASAAASRAGATEAAAARFAARYGDEFATGLTAPAAIGAMEGGGAYQQTVAQAYAALEGRTDLSPAEKSRIANMAGLEAAAIQAPVGALTGRLTARFEANPLFHSRGVGSALANVGKEGVEEFVQSASGQLVGNVALRDNVDPSQDLLEGVGEQAALGLVGGVGAAGVVQAPVATLRSSVAAAKFAGRKVLDLGRGAADAVARGVEARNQRVVDQVQSESPVSAPRMDEAVDAARRAAPEIASNVRAAVETAGAKDATFTPEERQSVVDHFEQVLGFDGASEAERVPSSIRPEVEQAGDRFDAVRRVADVAKDESQPPERRLSAGLYLMDVMRRNEVMLDSVPEEALAKLPQDDPAVRQVEDYQVVLESLARHPLVRDAIAGAMQLTSTITPEKASSDPEVAKDAARLASLAPEKTDPEVNRQVLLHATDRNLGLSQEEQGSLRAANAVHEANRIQAKRSSQLGLTPSEAVSREIQTETSDPSTLHKSALAHMDGVVSAIEGGNLPLAQRRMRHFVNFAQSMQNKVAALNENLLRGDGGDRNRTAYEAYNPRTGKFFTSRPGAYLIGSSRGSVAQAQQTSVDADAVAYVANELGRAFPQLGASEVQVVPLHASVSQTTAREAARDYRVARDEGNLAEYLGLSEETSPNIPIEQVQSSTQSDQSRDIPPAGQSPTADAAPLGPTTDGSPPSGRDQTSSPDRNTTAQTEQERPSQDRGLGQSSDPASGRGGPVPETPSGTNDGVPDQSPDQQTVQSPGRDPAGPARSSEVSDQKSPEVAETPDIRSQEEAPPEEVPSKIRPIDAAYPVLLGSEDGSNRLKSSFELPSEEPTSRLTASEDPIDLVMRALSSARGFTRVMGEARPGDAGRVTAKVSRAYAALLEAGRRAASEMDRRLSSVMNERQSKGKKLDLGFEELRALNIVDLVEDERARYNPELRDAAVLAGLQWLLTEDQRRRPLDAEDVSKILSVPVTEVTDEQVEAFNQGSHLASSVSDLGDVVTRFWGVRPLPDAPQGVVRGVPEGVAKEVLRGLEAAGLARVVEIREEGRTYYQVQSLARELLGEEIYADLAAWPSAVEVVSVVDPVETTFLGSPPPTVPRTQLRNPLVRLTREQRDMAEAEQATEHRLDEHFVGLLTDLGEEQSVALFGHGELAEDATNVNHRRSLESVNLTVRMAYRSVMGRVAEARSWAASNGVADAWSVPIHYAYEFTSVNRLQMVGAHNPQANKLSREAVLPTWSTMDLTDPGQRGRFLLGVAQHLEDHVEGKVHKQPRRETVRQVTAALSGELAPVVEMLSSRSRGRSFTSDQVELLRRVLGRGGPVSPAALHAIDEYARYVRSSVEEKKNFRTSVYLEADGITDGPVNAMVHAATGAFTRNWVQVVRKGGLFLGMPGTTSNTSPDQIDLYEYTTGFLRQSMSRLRSELASDESTLDVARHLDVLNRVMSRLLPDVSLDAESGELVVRRGLVKNPLTVTIYGAGPLGIAAKITRALTDAVYEQESSKVAFLRDNPRATRQEVAEHLFGAESSSPEEALSAYERYNADMASVLDRRVERGPEGLSLVDESSEIPKNTSMRDGPEGFTLLPRQVENLRANVLRLVVGPMREAIQASIGETGRGVDVVRRATQVQSIYLEHAFREAVQARLDAKKRSDPSFRRSDFLSSSELSEVYEGLRHLSPYVRTEGQNMLVSGTEKGPVGTSDQPVSFSRTLDGKLSTPASIYGPANSGVSGIPYVVIGTGDGLMMQKVSTMPGAPQGTLKVFDGMNMPLDQVEEQSRMLNEAVYRGWSENPLDAIARSYAEFVRDGNLEVRSEEMRVALSEALLGPGKKDATAEQVEQMVRALASESELAARENQARKNALARVQVTVDHMASAESPFETSTTSPDLESLEGMSDDQVTARLNELYAEELNKLTESKNDEAKSEKVEKLFGEFEGLTSADLPRFVASLPVSGDQRRLLVEAARNLADEGWTVVSTGSQETTPGGRRVQGHADFGSRTIVVRNGSAETLLHEMLHAATLGKVWAYYSDPSSLSREEREAVRRIELLMGEWLDSTEADLPNLNEASRRAMLDARSTVLGHLGDGTNGELANRANALDEFVSWVLSNQELARAASRRRVKNPLARVVGEVLEYLKKLLGLRSPGSDIYSNLRFNTEVLMRSAPSVASGLGRTVMYQSTEFGQDDRLSELRRKFFDKVARHVSGQVDPARRLDAQYRSFVAKVQADEVFESFDSHGFPMDAQQASTFQMVVAALATEAELDPNSLQRVEELYRHVITRATADVHLLVGKGPDDVLTPSEEFEAQERLKSLTGVYGTETDAQGRSTLLPGFLALAAVHDGFREVLRRIELPSSRKLPGETLDDRLTNLGTEAMDRLGVLMGGEKTLTGKSASSVGAAVDVLTNRLSEVEADQRGRVEQFVTQGTGVMNKANAYVVREMQNLSRLATAKLEEVKQGTDRRSVKTLAAAGQLLAGIVDEEVAGDQARSLMSLANKRLTSKTWHDFLNELVGRTSENAPVYDMIKTVRSAVQQARQQFREHLPEVLASRFDREVTSEEWSAMFHGLARTDLASLLSGYTLKQVSELMVDPAKLASETQVLEARVLAKPQGPLMVKKARDLAGFMNTGKAPENLLRNARAIERLPNEGVRRPPEVDATLVTDLDHLTSLYALEGISDVDRDVLSPLVREQGDGVSFVLSYLEGQRRDELAKVDGSPGAELNHFKGHVPSVQEGKNQGRTLVVADDQEYLRLRQLGLVRVADYDGVSADDRRGSMGYYFSPLSGQSSYNQGVVQTARSTASGVDPVTGYSVSVATAGRITDADAVERVRRRLARGGSRGNEQLMPVFAGDGSLVAYERSLDPLQEERLGRSTNLADMVGVWRGRQVEELMGQKFNEALVRRLHDMWDREEVTRRDEYVNLMDPREQRRDPVAADAVRLLPRETRELVASLFGEGQFWVRRDMVNDALGYRKASVGDAWTGNSRLSPGAQKSVRDLATAVFGVDAYKRLVQAETLVQNVVTDARVLIVVKSVVVPVANLVANVYQLSARGVPLTSTVRGMPRKLAEVNGYVRDRVRVMEIDAELRAAEGAKDLVKTRKLGAERQSIQDNWRRLSIWPLVEAGELSSVSDVGIGKEELDLSNGRLTQYVEGLVDRLPEGVRTAGRYFVVGRDTALFKGLQKSVEYGDFLAKAVLYDDLVKRQGKTSAEALAAVTEEFVNYDRLAGRTRDYLENMGLMWFWNFKIRSTKVALSMIRNNPLHALTSMLVPSPPMVGSVGSPLTDNLFSVGLDGRLDYSVGPGQGLRAHQLLPWVQLVS